MESKKLLSNKEAVKKEIPINSEFDDRQFLHAQNSNSVEFQQSFTMEGVSKLNNSVTNTIGKSPPSHHDTLTAEASVEISSVDSNVNKQQICLSEKMDAVFPRRETPLKPKKHHVTFSNLAKSTSTECHPCDCEHLDSIATNQCLTSGQSGYHVLIPRSEHWEQSTGDTNRPYSSSFEKTRSKESALSQSLSSPAVYPNDEDQTVVSKEEPLSNEQPEVFKRETKISHEVIPSKSSRDSNEGVATESLVPQNQPATESLVLQNQPATAKSLSTDRNGTKQVSYSEYQRRLESLISKYNQEGQIIVHRPYPGVVEEASVCSTYVPGVCEHPVREAACEQLYDDSVFPSNHRLNTSEDMRAAMMQVRKQTYYRRKVDAAREVVAEGGFSLDESLRPNYSRFSRPTRSNSQLKYRNVMAALYRRSFNDWKSQLSTVAGQELDPDEGVKTVRNSFLDKLGYIGCPRCHQGAIGIYGKPCLCQKVLPNLCNSNNENRKRINSRRRKIQSVKKNLTGCTEISATLSKSAESDQSPSAGLTEGDETGKNCMNTGLLGDSVAESSNQGSKSYTAINVAQAGAAGEQQQSSDQAGDDGRVARTPDTGKLTSSNKRSRVLMKDLEVLNCPESKSRPLREWEITTLEGTLKKCLS